MQDIGKNIKLLRMRQGLTQDALAEALYVTRQSISNWENGVSRPDVEMLIQLAAALGVDANTVLYGPPELIAQQKAQRRWLLRAGVFAAAVAGYALLYPWALQVQARYYLLWAYLLRVGALPLLWFGGGLLLMQALQLWAGLQPLGLPRARRAVNALLLLIAALIVPMLLFYLIGTLQALGKSSVSLSFPGIPLYTPAAVAAFAAAFHMPYLGGLLAIARWLTGSRYHGDAAKTA